MQKAKLAELFKTPKNRIIVALDNVESLEQVATLVALLSPYAGWFKIGFETILGFGAKAMVDVVIKNGGKVFLDPKLCVVILIGPAREPVVRQGGFHTMLEISELKRDRRLTTAIFNRIPIKQAG